MMSVEIEPQYLAQDDDVADAEYDSMPMLSNIGGVTHAMIQDGVLSIPGSGIEGEDEYGDEVLDDAPEFTKFKRDKVFLQADYSRRKTKIVGTIGPACSEIEQMVKLLDGGMTCARFNLSHGTQKENMRLLAKFRQARRLRPQMTCALMLELRGREVRISHVDSSNNLIRCKSGASVLMCGGEFDKPSDNENFRINNENVLRYLKNNDVVYFDDGKVVGIVKAILDTGVEIEIKIGGSIRGNCAVRFVQGKHAQLPLCKKEDMDDLQKISQQFQIDFLAVPFVSGPSDLTQFKRTLGPFAKQIQLLAKIDMDEGLRRFEEIIKEADGAILVRNELQWEIQAEKLMTAEKWAISCANDEAKPIMIQSQVLESMIKNEEPSRQDLADISQSVLLGADCLMLTHETSMGAHPLNSITSLSKAIAEAESVYDYDQAYTNNKEYLKNKGRNIDILCHTGCQIAFEQKENVDMFVVITENGRVARHIAKQRPKQPILACSVSGQAVRQMNMMRGVTGYKIPEYEKKDREEDLLELVLSVAQEQLICNLPTSKVIVFYGAREDTEKSCDITFKVIGGEKPEDEEDEEDEEEVDEGDENEGAD